MRNCLDPQEIEILLNDDRAFKLWVIQKLGYIETRWKWITRIATGIAILVAGKFGIDLTGILGGV